MGKFVQSFIGSVYLQHFGFSSKGRAQYVALFISFVAPGAGTPGPQPVRFLVLVTHVGSVHLFCGGSSKVNNAFFVFSFFYNNQLISKVLQINRTRALGCASPASRKLLNGWRWKKGINLGWNLYLNASTKLYQHSKRMFSLFPAKINKTSSDFL